MLTGRNSSGFQQRCDKGCCRTSEAVSVARSGTLPAGVLEGADGFGLKAHSAPTCLDNSPTVILKQVCLFVSRHRICRLLADSVAKVPKRRATKFPPNN